MQVHSRKLERIAITGKTKLYVLLGIAVMVAAILVSIFIVAPHHMSGNTTIAQICIHKSLHFCYFPSK